MRSGDCRLIKRIDVQLSGFAIPSVRLDLTNSGIGQPHTHLCTCALEYVYATSCWQKAPEWEQRGEKV